MSYREDGILTLKDLGGNIPSEERLEQRGCVIVECIDRIPCNPCVDACPRGAIRIEGDIKELPEVDFQRCDGCGLCISACPGLAIFMVRYMSGTDRAEVSIPYELPFLPEKGDVVTAMDRAGKEVGDADVVRVRTASRQDRTAVVTLSIDRRLAMAVRHFKRKQ
jgi:Fe-S-cluster-containing hydrogenase component 2